MELEHLKSTFTEIKNFPPQVVARTIQVADEQIRVPIIINEEEPVVVEQVTTVQITLPYAGKEEEIVIKEIKKHVKQVQPKINTRIAFKAKRLSSFFNIKDKVKKMSRT